jgi:hypothetical protein
MQRLSPQKAASFDHLVSADKEQWRDSQAKRTRGLQIDDKVELGRKLDRQIAGFRAFEDLINEPRRAPEVVSGSYAVADVTAVFREEWK